MQKDPVVAGAELASRIVFGVFGFAFAGIGLTTLGFLWGTPFNQFGSPPLFFRIFGSFIALCFVAMGGSTCFAAVMGARSFGARLPLDQIKDLQDSFGPGPTDPLVPHSSSPLNYSCSNCGAQLSTQSEVSPLGDVKCSFCHQWFNIHRPKENA
jgi:DNA-directed RNA polymerase subunit RPC12/RpoP